MLSPSITLIITSHHSIVISHHYTNGISHHNTVISKHSIIWHPPSLHLFQSSSITLILISYHCVVTSHHYIYCHLQALHLLLSPSYLPLSIYQLNFICIDMYAGCYVLAQQNQSEYISLHSSLLEIKSKDIFCRLQETFIVMHLLILFTMLIKTSVFN